MAASSTSVSCVGSTGGEEPTSPMEAAEGPGPGGGTAARGRDSPKTEPESADPFKKPFIFSAPSLASRRNANGAAPSKTATGIGESPGSPPRADPGEEPPPRTEEEHRHGEGKAPDAAPGGGKAEARPRAPPAGKAPPVGKAPPLPYSEPSWGGQAPDDPYGLEILKNGSIVDTVPLTHRSFFVVGRLPVCDVPLEHPSISRYHAVVQYRGQPEEERGFYVHDLGSTHGTVVNKNKIPPNTYIRIRVGHVLKFGGSTRLFILQGPEFDEEEECELSVTELKERARKQREELEKRMMGDGSDDEEKEDQEEGGEDDKAQRKVSKEDSGCSWGMAEEAAAEEDENEENPFSTEFHEDQEAAYLKDPKKALQGFYDREDEELELEYEDKNHGTWLCRIKLPVDDAMGRQLVAEVTHTGKKKEAAVQCCLEACRMLEARGLLRQEAVSRKRKKKNWEDEDYYDSDDDTFLDRTGTVEKKRQERMKKAGKIEEKPETYESLLSKLSEVEKELVETQGKLSVGLKDTSNSSSEDTLEAFMTSMQSQTAMDGMERRKLHRHLAELNKSRQRLQKLVDLTRPAQMPSLVPSGSSESSGQKKALPLFGAMKGGRKFKLKTGTIGKMPLKRPNLPADFFNMKELPPGGEEEEEEEEEEEHQQQQEKKKEDNNDEEVYIRTTESNVETEESRPSMIQEMSEQNLEEPASSPEPSGPGPGRRAQNPVPPQSSRPPAEASSAAPGTRQAGKKKVLGPSRPPGKLLGQYPEDDPDYCVWMPPAGQTGDGRTHLNDKYGY